MKKMWLFAATILLVACTQQGNSNAMMKAKCIEIGQNHPADFQDKLNEKDRVSYNFYYSPVLDTCVVEMAVERLVNDDVGNKYALYDILNSGGDAREIISYVSWCVDGTIPGHPDQGCTTRLQYEAEKKQILPDVSS